MDRIQSFLNIVVPIISVFTIIFVLPIYLFLKLFYSFVKPYENVAGKVILITGASSGIGEYVAYEYAKLGSRLVLVARREHLLHEVARKARQLGSPDVVVLQGDVSKVDDCKRFVQETINHFDRVDHLVNNAGVAPTCWFEEYTDMNAPASIMNINFWGSVYMTHFAIPYLRESKGKIIVISSSAEWLSLPLLSIYSATKAALTNFYQALRVELGSDISITIVNPGLIDSEITTRDFRSRIGVNFHASMSTEGCAKAVMKSSRCGKRSLTVPFWVLATYPWRVLCPEILELLLRFQIHTRTSIVKNSLSKDSVQSLELKKE